MRLKNVIIAYIIVGLLVESSAWARSGWQYVAPMPHGRYGHDAVVGKDGKIYVMGGMTCDIEDGKMGAEYPDGRFSNLRYDPDKNVWEYRSPVVGGGVCSGRYYVFDLDTYDLKYYQPKSAEERKQLPSNAILGRLIREGYGVRIVTSAADQIYWLGGMGRRWGNGESMVLDYDLARDQWTRVTCEKDSEKQSLNDMKPIYHYTIPPMLERRMDHEAMITLDGKIYVMGGWRRPVTIGPNGVELPEVDKPREVSDTMECYDPATAKWEYKKPLKTKRAVFAAVVGRDEKIYVFGGVAGMIDDPTTPILDTVEVYDPKTDLWSQRSSMPSPRRGHAAVSGADHRIYVLGGSRSLDDGPSKDVFIYDPTGDKWERGPSMNVARSLLAAVATPDGKIYAIGGTDVGAHGGSDALNTFIPRKSHLYTGRVQETVEVLDISK